MATSTDCYTCAGNADTGRLPPRELIAADDLWRVAHAFGSALPGWLVLIPRRHVTSIAALTDAEAAALGTWQVRLSRALQQVMDCEKTYVAQFAEAAGFAHVHFHIVPRPAGLTHDLRGPGIFGLLGVPPGQQVADDRMDEIARELTLALRTP